MITVLMIGLFFNLCFSNAWAARLTESDHPERQLLAAGRSQQESGLTITPQVRKSLLKREIAP